MATLASKMPSDLFDVHAQISDDLVFLCLHWKEYKKLFATDQNRIDLLNATAPNFFAHLDDLVWSTTMLGLCRLTDPPKSVGRDNLTVRRLPRLVPDSILASKVQDEVGAAVDSAEFARDWRNRRLAHRSLELLKNPHLAPLASATRAGVEGSIDLLCKVLNTISVHYDGVHHDFNGVVTAFEGSEALLFYLSSGLEAEQVRKADAKRWRPPHY
jgi:hypothetical protein